LQVIPIRGWAFAKMIVCSCNVLTDQDVRGALSGNEAPPRSTGDVYRCLGCSAQCGRCARTIRRIMDEPLTGAACCQAAGSGS
jgi:bacterioferritin-associated ferredoxin